MQKLVVFAYNFHHAKTQNGLLRLVQAGLKPALILAQDKKELKPNPDSIGLSPKDPQALVHPENLAKMLGIPYLVTDHDSQTAIDAIKHHAITHGVILGARILKKPVIDSVPGFIVNAHPGLLPGNRGLDNLKRAILMDMMPAVTFHTVDERIDWGKLIAVRPVPLYKNDSIHSVMLRHSFIELDHLSVILIQSMWGQIAPKSFDPGPYNEPLGDKYDKEILERFPHWLRKYRIDG